MLFLLIIPVLSEFAFFVHCVWLFTFYDLRVLIKTVFNPIISLFTIDTSNGVLYIVFGVVFGCSVIYIIVLKRVVLHFRTVIDTVSITGLTGKKWIINGDSILKNTILKKECDLYMHILYCINNFSSIYVVYSARRLMLCVHTLILNNKVWIVIMIWTKTISVVY